MIPYFWKIILSVVILTGLNNISYIPELRHSSMIPPEKAVNPITLTLSISPYYSSITISLVASTPFIIGIL